MSFRRIICFLVLAGAVPERKTVLLSHLSLTVLRDPHEVASGVPPSFMIHVGSTCGEGANIDEYRGDHY